jgi:hypothetical protein
MENKQVTIVNTIKSRVGINVPDLHLKRVWEKKGVKKTIDFDTLQEAFYDPSVEYLLREGILYIDDMEVKIALGLEEEESETPNIVVLSDADLKRFMTVMPIFEFKTKVKELGREQVQSLVDFAIENELTDYEKCEFLKVMTQTDIIRAVQLNRDNKEV